MSDDQSKTTAEQAAYEAGWNLGEMAGGVELDHRLNPYRDRGSRLAEKFAEGWAAGQEWWNEKQDVGDAK